VWTDSCRYLRKLVCKRTPNCCPFDQDDYLADVRVEAWLRIRDRALPCESLPAFESALARLVLQVVVDQHRINTVDERTVRTYSECREVVYESCHATELWASETRESRQERIATEMVRRSRFDAVTQLLCKRVIRLLERGASLGVMLGALESSGFWDLGFLLEHLQVLYRWAYYELRRESLGLAA